MWPPVAIAVLTSVLGGYSWRRRRQPGALPFAVACGFGFLWAVGSFLEVTATDPSQQARFYAFKIAWLLPAVCAVTSFILQFAGLGRWLTRRVVVWCFALPSLVVGVLYLTNEVHRLGWPELRPLGPMLYVQSPGIVVWVALAYSAVLAVLNLVVLLRLFVRSPPHRWSAGLIMVGNVLSRAAFAFEVYAHDAVQPLDPEAAAVGIPFSLYAVALFGFHVFDPVPHARTAAISQMHEGMVVLDVHGRVAYANPAAEGIIRQSLASLRGRDVRDVLPADPVASPESEQPWTPPPIIQLPEGRGDREYAVSVTDLADSLGQPLGRLLLLRDVTDERRAQSYHLDKERALAALRERERLARELHDSIGQVLGYVSMQAQAADKWLKEGDVPRALSLIGRLTEVAQQAHADVREAILELKAGFPATWSFLPALREYAQDFERQYGITTRVAVTGAAAADPFGPETGVQVLRVIQEAVSNARKHGHARTVWIDVEQTEAVVRIAVRDDGEGIAPAVLTGPPRGHFGMTFMRERMAGIGGSLQVTAPPAGGTLVLLTVPLSRGSEVPV